MLSTIKSITIFHIIGLLIGNVGYEYFVTGALGFNLPAFMLAIVILFLVGIVLICLGIIALYIANIQNEVINRPLYVVKSRKLESNKLIS